MHKVTLHLLQYVLGLPLQSLFWHLRCLLRFCKKCSLRSSLTSVAILDGPWTFFLPVVSL